MSNYLFQLDPDLVEEIQKNIKNTSVIRLFSAIDGYIRFSTDIDTEMRTDGQLNEKVRVKSRGFYETILEEISQIVSRSLMTIRFLVDLEMKVGQTDEPITDNDYKTLKYFRKMKQQQIELLMCITEQIEAIQVQIDYTRKMRRAVCPNSPVLKKVGFMIGMARERMERRPTAVLRIQGSGDNFRQLNDSFKRITEFENRYWDIGKTTQDENGTDGTFSPYDSLIKNSYRDVQNRKLRIEECLDELKNGWKILKKLAVKGYSPSLKKSLDKLMAGHEARIESFKKDVQDGRCHHFHDSRFSFSPCETINP